MYSVPRTIRSRFSRSLCEIQDRRSLKREEATRMKGDQQEEKTMPGTISLFVSTLTHVLLLAPVIYIVALYFEKYDFFSWHPICLTVGVGLLMTEAVFGISGESYLTHRVSRMGRVTIHWILHSFGLILMIIGLVIAIVAKNERNKNHFESTHAKLGLCAIVWSLIVAAFGVVANNTRWLYPKVRPVFIKVGHAFGGIAVTILLIAAVINGTYKHSFPGSETGRDLVFASLFIAGVLILAKPLLGAVSRSRLIFRSSKPSAPST